MAENIALEKKQQSKFVRKLRKTKERVQTGESEQNKRTGPPKSKHGVVYVGHIPHGFYEKEMLAYFKQFGKVSNLRLCRSDKTGRSKGYAFVEFADPEVAKVAAETMDNYLMFNRRLEAKFVNGERSQRLRKYKPPSWSAKRYPLKVVRKKVNMEKNKNIDEETHLEKCTKIISTVNKSLQKLQELGINYSFQPVDVPEALIAETKLTMKNKSKNKKRSKNVPQKIKQEKNIKRNIIKKKKQIVRKK